MFQVAATISKVSTRADHTISISLETQEIEPEGMAELFRLKGTLGWFLFAKNEILASDVPQEDALEFKNDKTPSQRLRAVLYRYWEKHKELQKVHPRFNGYYEYVLEKKIDEIKEKL